MPNVIKNSLLSLLVMTSLLFSNCKKPKEETVPSTPEPTVTLMPKTYGNKPVLYAINSSDGNILAINTGSQHNVLKISSTDGHIIWAVTYSIEEQIFPGSIEEAHNGDVIVTGKAYTSPMDSIGIASLNSNGEKKWIKLLPGGSYPLVKRLKSGNVMVAALPSVYIINNNGDIISTKNISLSGIPIHQKMIQLQNEDIVICGKNDDGTLTYKMELVRLSPDGTLQQQVQIGEPTPFTRCVDLVETTDGKILACGEELPDGQTLKGFVITLNNSLALVRKDVYGGDDTYSRLSNIITTTEGYVAVGATRDMVGQFYSGYMISARSSGEKIFERTYPVSENRTESLRWVKKNEKGYLVLGNGAHQGSSAGEFFLMEVNNDGNTE